MIYLMKGSLSSWEITCGFAQDCQGKNKAFKVIHLMHTAPIYLMSEFYQDTGEIFCVWISPSQSQNN